MAEQASATYSTTAVIVVSIICGTIFLLALLAAFACFAIKKTNRLNWEMLRKNEELQKQLDASEHKSPEQKEFSDWDKQKEMHNRTIATLREICSYCEVQRTEMRKDEKDEKKSYEIRTKEFDVEKAERICRLYSDVDAFLNNGSYEK